MIIGRLLAYLFLCLTLMIFGGDALRMLEGSKEEWITISQVIDLSIAPKVTEVDGGIMPAGWENILKPVLNIPAFYASLTLSVILFFASRSKFR